MPRCFTSDDDLQIMGRAKSEALGPVIHCLLWNIFKARRENWINDFRDLSADRDLVMLQEAVHNAPTDAVFENSSRFEWVMARSFRHPVNHVDHGIKTGSVSQAIDRQFFLSPYTEPLLNTQKLLLSTSYALHGSHERLLVLNMHAINFVGVKKYVGQLDQLEAALGKHTGPVILGGDFNTWNPGRLSHFFGVAAKARLVEAAMQRQRKLAHMNQHLDHLFYRGLRLRSVQSLDHVLSSDHSPITATFELPP